MVVNKEGSHNVGNDCLRYLFRIISFNRVTSHLSCFFHNYVLYFIVYSYLFNYVIL
jgi:hypothetical protein